MPRQPGLRRETRWDARRSKEGARSWSERPRVAPHFRVWGVDHTVVWEVATGV